MGYEQIRFYCSFDRAVSLLSISGYYLEGFVEIENKKEGYLVYGRSPALKSPVAKIFRNQSFEFLEEPISRDAKTRRNQIRKTLLEGIVQITKKRIENTGFAKNSARKDKNNKK